jgi:UDP-2,3-diacylglucosamine pyrophosphatase LpxH
VAWSRDGKRLAVAHGDIVSIVDARTQRVSSIKKMEGLVAHSDQVL